MPRYTLYQVDAFTRTKFEGNPAGVVSDADGLTEKQMQAIAREMNNSETAFILSPASADHDVWVRFFTPTVEVPICGHATISAHFVRALEKNLPSCRIYHKTGAGILPVEIVKRESGYKIVMTQGKITVSETLTEGVKKGIQKALDLSDTDMDGRFPLQVASTWHSKVMVGIRERSVLHALKPDMTALSALSRVIGSNGFYVFTTDSDDKDIMFHGRMFAPAIGINEDPVTGNANGPLGAYLIHNGILSPGKGGILQFSAKQGEAIGRPGIIDITVETEDGKPVLVKVAGEAVIAFRTEIEI